MRALGLRATEFGPVGYLGSTAAEVTSRLATHEMTLVGGFVPVVLRDAGERERSLEAARTTAELYAACGASFLVSAIVADERWGPRVPLDSEAWRRVRDGLARLDDLAARAGLVHVLHPHVGTLIENGEDVERALEGTDVAVCLDTGHLVLGGLDPVAFARAVGARVRHVHLKDVSEAVADRFRAGELSLVAAVQAGLFRPLGEGVARVAETIAVLEAGGYTGWYVLEQDTALANADVPASGGPAEDVRRSIEYLRAVIGTERTTATKEGTE